MNESNNQYTYHEVHQVKGNLNYDDNDEMYLSKIHMQVCRVDHIDEVEYRF